MSLNTKSDATSTKCKSHKKTTDALRIQFGLSSNTSKVLNVEDTCVVPKYREALINCLVDGSVIFEGSKSSIVDKGDLCNLYGQSAEDKDNYLSNFTIEAYLSLISKDPQEKGAKVEKGLGRDPVQELLKRKPPLLQQDVVLVPCNPGKSEHWFLLTVHPQEKEMFVIDSLADKKIYEVICRKCYEDDVESSSRS